MKVSLEQTSGACPEQYNAFIDGKQVGYLRLRHGSFTVECPDSGGELVFSASPQGDGAFTLFEREQYLKAAKKAIKGWLKKQKLASASE